MSWYNRPIFHECLTFPKNAKTYTTSAAPFFIDQVQVGAYSGEHLVLVVKGQRCEYSVAGNPFASRIDDLKKRSKTPGMKADASKQVSQILRNLEQFRVK